MHITQAQLTNDTQTILFCPLTNASPVAIIAPMLSVLRLRQVQLLSRAVQRCQGYEDVTMRTSLWRRSWWLVLDNLLVGLLLGIEVLTLERRMSC